MQRIRLGKSGIEVSRVGFGGIPLQRLTEEDALRVIQAGVDGGIDWIDTAHGYGSSEERFGKALARYDRSRLRIFTKGPAKDPEAVRLQLGTSLERLRTSYVDLYQFHLVPSAEAWQAMKRNGTVDVILEARARGEVRHVGVSAHNPETALALVEDPVVEVIQWPFNFMVEEEGRKVLESCRRHDVGFIAMKPFGGGMLDHAAACIRFLLQFPDVALDPGFERAEEVAEVLSLASEEDRGRVEPTAADRAAMERLKGELGRRFCHRCGYCSPCAQGVAIIPLMTMESLIRRFTRDQVTSGWAKDAAASVERCTECGACEKKCPYELPIRKGIREGAAAYGRLLPGAGA
jgi:predicted aldo/keto reductase-like oxidoreductase